MSQRFDSPYPKEFPGYIVLPDDLTWPQLIAIDTALYNSRGVPTTLGASASMAALNMVVEWHIEGFPEKPTAESIFTKGTPKREAMKVAKFFYLWVFDAVVKIFNAESEIPKAYGSGPTDMPKTPETTQPQPS